MKRIGLIFPAIILTSSALANTELFCPDWITCNENSSSPTTTLLHCIPSAKNFVLASDPSITILKGNHVFMRTIYEPNITKKAECFYENGSDTVEFISNAYDLIPYDSYSTWTSIISPQTGHALFTCVGADAAKRCPYVLRNPSAKMKQ